MRNFGLTVSRKTAGKAIGAACFAALLSGCSSDALRFQDGFYTGTDSLTTASVPGAQLNPNVPPATVPGGTTSVPAQQPYGQPAQQPASGQNDTFPSQPYPGDGATGGRYALAPATPAPVQSAPLAAPGATARQSPAAASPMQSASAAAPQSAGRPEGWSATDAPRVTLQQNETLYSVARRYGVPPEQLMKVNGITDATRVAAGQQLIIPGFSRGGQAVAAAPAAASADDAPAIAATAGSYTVQSGDTLSAISRRTGVSIAALRQANGISGDTIRLGQTLSIPGAGDSSPSQSASTRVGSVAATESESVAEVEPVSPAPAVQQVASTSNGAARPAGYSAPKPETTTINAAQQQEVASIAPETTGIGKLRWPARGQVVTAFGAQDGNVRNDGIDISLPEGTEVKAAENGVVIYAGSGLKEFGNTVLVRHDNGLVTVYGHAKDLKVSRGDTVSRGQVIAHSGMSGEATQPKLHFEVRENATPVDPGRYLE